MIPPGEHNVTAFPVSSWDRRVALGILRSVSALGGRWTQILRQ